MVLDASTRMAAYRRASRVSGRPHVGGSSRFERASAHEKCLDRERVALPGVIAYLYGHGETPHAPRSEDLLWTILVRVGTEPVFS